MGKLKLKGIKLTGYIRMDVTTLTDVGGQRDTGEAKFYDATTTHFGINQGFNGYNVFFDLYGKGFKYQFGQDVPTAGTVKKVEVRVDDDVVLRLEKLKLPALEALKLYQMDDPFAAMRKLLKGNDTVIGSDESDTLLWGGKGNDLLWGRHGMDILDGFKGNDVNDGGEDNDQLIDTRGDDTFQFSTPFQVGAANLHFNYDTILKLGKTDEVYLKYQYFDAAGMSVSKGELAFSDEAQDGNDFFLFFAGIFSYDADADGPGEATPIFGTLNDAKLTHKMIEIGVSGDFY